MTWMRDKYKRKEEKKEKRNPDNVLNALQNQKDAFKLDYPQLGYVIPLDSVRGHYSYLHSVSIYVEKKKKDWTRYLPCLSLSDYYDKIKCPFCKYGFSRFDAGFFTVLEFYKENYEKFNKDEDIAADDLLKNYKAAKKLMITRSDVKVLWDQYEKRMSHILFSCYRDKKEESSTGSAIVFIEPVGLKKLEAYALNVAKHISADDKEIKNIAEGTLKPINYEYSMPMLTYEQALYNIWSKDIRLMKWGKTDQKPYIEDIKIDDKDADIIKNMASNKPKEEEDGDLKVPF